MGKCRPAVRGLFRSSNVSDKPDTLAWNRAHEFLLPCAVAEGLAHGIDAAVEGRVRHDAAAPNRCNEVILADDAIGSRSDKPKGRKPAAQPGRWRHARATPGAHSRA